MCLTPSNRSPSNWGKCLGVVLVVGVLAVACDRVTVAFWDDWRNVRVVGAVVDEAGEPLRDARFLLVLDPNHHRYHMGISAFDMTPSGEASGMERLCAQAVVAHADEEGRIDVVLRIHRGGRSSLLFRRAGEPPAFEGIHLVIVEAEGRAPVCGDPRTWTCEEYDASTYEIGAKLDLGRIVAP